MPGMFDRLRGKSDDEPVDLEARSPESGLKYEDIALLGQMMERGLLTVPLAARRLHSGAARRKSQRSQR